MITLRQAIAQAQKRNQAVGHFNISNIETLWAAFEAAKKVGVPVIIGVSEGERKFIGIKQAVALVRSIREEFQYPIFLNADHTYSFIGVKEAVDAGADSVIFDGTKLPLHENIELAKQCVSYAHAKNPEIIVEGELGYIGQSSQLLDKIPEGVTDAELTKPEAAEAFVRETGVDMLAPAVGNIHGMLKNMPEPRLDIQRIAAVRMKAGVPLVLHGGSGTSDEDFSLAIKNGISVIHINTEIRLAWRKGIEAFLAQDANEVAPYKIAGPAKDAVYQLILRKLELFSA